MASPVKPSDVKTMLPTTSGTFCERMKRLIQFPLALYNLVSYLFKEDGTPTTQFQSDLCALECIGNGGGDGNTGGENPNNPDMPAPTGVNATDGTYEDKIRVSWNAVTVPSGVDPVTEYNVYRSESTNTDPNESVLVGTVSAPTTTLDDPVDSDLAQGTIYRYWVRATNGDDVSAYSGSDVGSASAPTPDIPAITDLMATQGFANLDGSPIALQWTPPTGATKYSVYRNTVNDYATATKILDKVTPQNTQDHITSTQTPDHMWNNIDTIVCFHFPPSNTDHYFFWVVAHKDSPPGISPESNEAEGWSRSFYAPYLGTSFRLNHGDSITEGVDFNGNIRVVLIPGGAAGAGGSQLYGGGGGGGGEVVVEELTLAPGDVVSMEADPGVTETANSPALSDGADGSDSVLKINGVEVMRAKAGKGGKFSGSGGGAGGLAGTGSTGVATPTIYAGHAGLPGSGSSGGGTGYRFGDKRFPAAWYNGFTGYDGNSPSKGVPGGGSKAAPGVEVLAEGGFGQCGFATIVSES